MANDQQLVTTQWTIENLSITNYSIFSMIDSDAGGTNFYSYPILFLTGPATPPYAINAVQIKFIPDNQPLAKPSWQSPNLNCEKHISEWASVFELVNRGIINKKPGSDFKANYIVELSQLAIILS